MGSKGQFAERRYSGFGSRSLSFAQNIQKGDIGVEAQLLPSPVMELVPLGVEHEDHPV